MTNDYDIEMQIEQILREFDFDKIALVMKTVGWTYREEETSPTVKDLRNTAKENLLRAYESYLKTKGEYDTTSSGGFSATFDGEGFALQFVLEEICTHPDDLDEYEYEGDPVHEA